MKKYITTVCTYALVSCTIVSACFGYDYSYPEECVSFTKFTGQAEHPISHSNIQSIIEKAYAVVSSTSFGRTKLQIPQKEDGSTPADTNALPELETPSHTSGVTAKEGVTKTDLAPTDFSVKLDVEHPSDIQSSEPSEEPDTPKELRTWASIIYEHPYKTAAGSIVAIGVIAKVLSYSSSSK